MISREKRNTIFSDYQQTEYFLLLFFSNKRYSAWSSKNPQWWTLMQANTETLRLKDVSQRRTIYKRHKKKEKKRRGRKRRNKREPLAIESKYLNIRWHLVKMLENSVSRLAASLCEIYLFSSVSTVVSESCKRILQSRFIFSRRINRCATQRWNGAKASHFPNWSTNNFR